MPREPGDTRLVIERGQKAILTDLKACSKTRNLRRGKDLHAEATEFGYDSSVYVANALVNMYAKCSCMVDARRVFEKMKQPSLVSWTVLILGYAENGESLVALEFFAKMRTWGLAPDALTFVAALKACTALALKGASESKVWGKELHCLAMKTGFDSDAKVQSSLIDFYANGGCMLEAQKVFNSITSPDVVSWTVLILGYADNGQGRTSLKLFAKMRSSGLKPNSVTIMAALRACTSLIGTEGARECMEQSKDIYELALENCCDSNIFVQSTLIDMYAKCGCMLEARAVFDRMQFRNVVSWNALLLGYADNGQAAAALDLFTRMRTAGPTPDSVTFSGALKACALLGALEFGRKIHSEMNNMDIVLVTCLVDFYVKCGSLLEAQRVFDLSTGTRNLKTWTALLSGFSSCGDVKTVFKLFEKMKAEDLTPDGITFLCLLACCSHSGLVIKGKECFEAMSTKYGIAPAIVHYNCMVDIFGRANRFDEAMALLQEAHTGPDDVTWKTLLGACLKWKNVEIGTLAFQSLISLNKSDLGVYAVMGQIYGSAGMFQEEMRMRKRIKDWKMPGETSWANELGEVHTFFTPSRP